MSINHDFFHIFLALLKVQNMLKWGGLRTTNITKHAFGKGQRPTEAMGSRDCDPMQTALKRPKKPLRGKNLKDLIAKNPNLNHFL
jgi:hypothetical protein